MNRISIKAQINSAHGVMLIAVALGIFARLKGLGTWPFSGDEFHTAQSVRYILEKGFPEFPFGGYYTRGILLQYLMALSSALGFEEEFGYRLIPVAFNLSGLPAIYLLSRRISGVTVACLATAFFSLSLWEIEFARYARMYAPFQAVFVWYVYFLYLAVIEGEKAARMWMLSLSLLSLFLYECGIFLLLLNFLPLFFEKVNWRSSYTCLCFGIFVAGYGFLSTNFTSLGAFPSLPPDFHLTGSGEGAVLLPSILGLEAVRQGGVSGALFLIFFLVNFFLVVIVFTCNNSNSQDLKKRICFASILIACSLNLFLFAFAIALICFLFEWINIEDRKRQYAKIALVVSCFNLLFIFFYLILVKFSALDIHQLIRATWEFMLIGFNYPNLLNKFIYQAIFVFPKHFVILCVVTLIGIVVAFKYRHNNKGIKFLSAILVALLVGVAMLKAPYSALRYFFFLYPLAMIIFCYFLFKAIFLLVENKKFYNLSIILVVCVLFSVSEDLNIKHAYAVDSEQIFFRIDMNKWQRAHFYPNMDTRGIAKVVNLNLKSTDIVVSTLRPTCYYLSKVDYVYYPDTGLEFANYSSFYGTREKWTGAKLIYREEDFWHLLDSYDGRIWLITRSEGADWIGRIDLELNRKFMNDLVFTSKDGMVNVYCILPSGTRSRTPGHLASRLESSCGGPP